MYKKIFVINCLLGSFFYSMSQTTRENITPKFELSNIEFHIPSFLALVQTDSGALTTNDTIFYKVKGQLLEGNGFTIPKTEIGNLASRTPWETIFEMVYAFRKEDRNKIENLFNNDSKAQIRKWLQKQGFLDEMAKIYSVAKVLAAVQYKNGIITYTTDSLDNVNLNYLVLENDKYKLSTLVDNGSVAWNIGQYLQFSPKPITPLKDVTIPDSIKSSETKLVTVRMTEPNQWLIVSTENPDYLMPVLIQDNGEGDLNPKEEEISFELRGTIFSSKGKQVLYTNALNYPAYHISKNFFINQAKHEIEIYE